MTLHASVRSNSCFSRLRFYNDTITCIYCNMAWIDDYISLLYIIIGTISICFDGFCTCEVLGGVLSSDSAITFTLQLISFPSTIAFTTTSPVFLAVILPLLFTVAIDSSELLHFISLSLISPIILITPVLTVSMLVAVLSRDILSSDVSVFSVRIRTEALFNTVVKFDNTSLLHVSHFLRLYLYCLLQFYHYLIP